ncbi:hypothetical protein EDB89DRAFT_1904507 [Lactarius sanguifluus]|nr:hypothetical protein EDB89DRAFT_1904507 [Lactarius sanguifluus]
MTASPTCTANNLPVSYYGINNPPHLRLRFAIPVLVLGLFEIFFAWFPSVRSESIYYSIMTVIGTSRSLRPPGSINCGRHNQMSAALVYDSVREREKNFGQTDAPWFKAVASVEEVRQILWAPLKGEDAD